MWSLSDAFALAKIEKQENPALDFEKLVQEIWQEMECENKTWCSNQFQEIWEIMKA